MWYIFISPNQGKVKITTLPENMTGINMYTKTLDFILRELGNVNDIALSFYKIEGGRKALFGAITMARQDVGTRKIEQWNYKINIVQYKFIITKQEIKILHVLNIDDTIQKLACGTACWTEGPLYFLALFFIQKAQYCTSVQIGAKGWDWIFFVIRHCANLWMENTFLGFSICRLWQGHPTVKATKGPQ